MDPITHAASGALAVLACPSRPRTAWAVPLAALAAASPDADVFFAPTPVDFLLLHRGITHSLFAAPFLGLILAALMFPWWSGRTPGAWPFRRVWLLAVPLVLLHIWLDCVTTYGTMIFLPFSDYRVRLNGVFIVDALLLAPMLWGLWRGRTSRAAAALCLIWILAYPALCVGLRMVHERAVARRLEGRGITVTHMAVLPDVLSPFFWRVLYQTDRAYPPSGTDAASAAGLWAPAPPLSEGESFIRPSASATVWHQGLDWRGRERTPAWAWPAADPALVQSLTAASGAARVFFHFTLMPVEERRLVGNSPARGDEYRFFDLRFSTALGSVRTIMGWRRNGGLPFQLLAREENGRWTEQRMIFSGAGRETPWQAPNPREPVPWRQWLLVLQK